MTNSTTPRLDKNSAVVFKSFNWKTLYITLFFAGIARQSERKYQKKTHWGPPHSLRQTYRENVLFQRVTTTTTGVTPDVRYERYRKNRIVSEYGFIISRARNFSRGQVHRQRSFFSLHQSLALVIDENKSAIHCCEFQKCVCWLTTTTTMMTTRKSRANRCVQNLKTHEP